MRPRHLYLVLLLMPGACASLHSRGAPARTSQRVTEASIRAHLEFPASDAMNGHATSTSQPLPR
ncbi:MAG: hypothetical protein DMF84_09875 [Acidobacteria bacterium]|nr:MAG: hypothetical protein DMF84_09875 [Acidobacteriota bacterium]